MFDVRNHHLAWLLDPHIEEVICNFPAQPSISDLNIYRKTYSTDEISMLSQIARARQKAHKKLDHNFAQRLMSDIQGIEMASSSLSSLHKAKRFKQLPQSEQTVADLCCGIGADSWGMNHIGLKTFGVDIDSDRCWMYAHNTKQDVFHDDVNSHSLPQASSFHLDPARRAREGRRTFQPDDYSPNPKQWIDIIERYQHGCVKLNPGINAYSLPEGEIEIISESGKLTQALLWVGELANTSSRSATRLNSDGSTYTLSGEPDRPDGSHPINDFLGTLDPSLERADLVGELLHNCNVHLVHPGTGLVTSSQPDPHPMIRWYKVIDCIPWNRKKTKAVLRAHDARIVQVRTRDGLINTDKEQQALRGNGHHDNITVFVYRIDQKRRTIIAEQLSI